MADDRVGLCERCRHAKIVATPRSRFWLCTLAAEDDRFDRYPRLPMLDCAGFIELEETDDSQPSP